MRCSPSECDAWVALCLDAGRSGCGQRRFPENRIVKQWPLGTRLGKLCRGMMTRYRRRAFSSGVAFASLLPLAAISWAQGQPQDRIVATAISDSEVTQLRGNVHPLARAEFDRGKVADSMLLPRITMFFTPSREQQAALSQLLSEQQDRGSPNYHRWITPREFGNRF